MNLFAGFSKEPAKETVMKETKAMITQKNRTKIDFMLEPKE
jgi:hypothetical protein